VRLKHVFPAQPSSIAAARHLALQGLNSTPIANREAIALVVSELATNAVQHARTSFVLRLELVDDSLRIEVVDDGGGAPEVLHPRPDTPRGRGLLIVSQMADEWGVEPAIQGNGKQVWARFALRGEPPDRDG
jgi:anti-sigma regulatory factor (Ser/Thr protein kinase)